MLLVQRGPSAGRGSEKGSATRPCSARKSISPSPLPPEEQRGAAWIPKSSPWTRRFSGRRQTLRGNAARAASPAHQASSFLLAAAASGQTPGSTPRRPRLVCELSGGARRKSPSLRAKPSPSLPGAWPASPFPLLFLPPFPAAPPSLLTRSLFFSPQRRFLRGAGRPRRAQLLGVCLCRLQGTGKGGGRDCGGGFGGSSRPCPDLVRGGLRSPAEAAWQAAKAGGFARANGRRRLERRDVSLSGLPLGSARLPGAERA